MGAVHFHYKTFARRHGFLLGIHEAAGPTEAKPKSRGRRSNAAVSDLNGCRLGAGARAGSHIDVGQIIES
jgi:hypothetical protein